MTFWKPGTSGPGGSDLSRASESDKELLPYLYNPRGSLPLSQQRAALPIAKHRLFFHFFSPQFFIKSSCFLVLVSCLYYIILMIGLIVYL